MRCRSCQRALLIRAERISHLIGERGARASTMRSWLFLGTLMRVSEAQTWPVNRPHAGDCARGVSTHSREITAADLPPVPACKRDPIAQIDDDLPSRRGRAVSPLSSRRAKQFRHFPSAVMTLITPSGNPICADFGEDIG